MERIEILRRNAHEYKMATHVQSDRSILLGLYRDARLVNEQRAENIEQLKTISQNRLTEQSAKMCKFDDSLNIPSCQHHPHPPIKTN
ncbi:hypothetical protein DPMN_139901 [Dreissena polymorpha]|uniref:Uncharacterized protein n=1 Tax=Dreissena polymorpha TaxID=45954 RepID=A0A9D4JG49_DREPO|nr:hypothetical protein DPMN_139901 [Dreissena polymorpha]